MSDLAEDRLVVIGADAGGMSGASQFRRLRPDLPIVAFDQGNWSSYSACGIPYLVAGDVDDVEDLVARTPEEFLRRQRIDVHLRHRVSAIDVDTHSITVADLDAGSERIEPYGKLLIATGARPVRPGLPGIDLPFVHLVKTLDDGVRLLGLVDGGEHRRVVIVGGGYIGLEMAEAYVRRGAHVTLLQGAAEVMTTLDPELGAKVREALVELGVEVHVATLATGFSAADDAATGGGIVHSLQGDFPADVAVLGLGVVPNGELAAAAGITTGVRGAIVVDAQQRTSAPDVWAAGDCCQSTHLVTGAPVHIALGTVANRQGRVAGLDLAGAAGAFPGVLGTAITKLCDLEIGLTGLSGHEATSAGLDHDVSTIESSTMAGYMPEAAPITVRLRYEATGGRVLGGQIIGGPGSAKRIDTIATAITAGMTVEEVRDLDLSYAPPFSPVWDPVLIAARVAASARADS